MPWYTVLLGDIDNDGDVDIVGGQYIFRNEMNDGNYLIFSLREREATITASGARSAYMKRAIWEKGVILKASGRFRPRGQGYVSQDSSDPISGSILITNTMFRWYFLQVARGESKKHDTGSEAHPSGDWRRFRSKATIFLFLPIHPWSGKISL